MAETLVSKIVANAGKNWSRNTVADGNWLNANTIVKLNQNDKTLAEAIDSLSASMPHILPEYPGFKLELESNETIKSIEQKTTGELVVEKQGIDIESSTLNDKLWAHLQTNKGCPVNNQYTQLYDEGEDPPDLNYLEPGNQGDGCTTSSLVLKPGIYSIYIELAYKPGNNIERIEKELSVRLCKGIDPIENAEFTFHCNDTYTEINQHRLINAVVKFETEGTLVIQGKTESGHAGGTLQIVNLYIVSVGGATGPKGDKGDPGADGFSPTVEITEGTHQHTIKITDKTHTATTLINDGADGSNGKSVELSANPLNAHLNWRQEGDTNWTDTGYAVSGAVGPRGSDGTSPTVTSAPNPDVGGYDVTFHYGDSLENEDTITVPSGVSGNPGISPFISTSAIPGTPGGTTVIITDATHDAEHPLTFDIRNGIDGTGATYDFDSNTLSGDGSINPIGVNTDLFYKKTETSAASELTTEFAKKLEAPNDSSQHQKEWFVHTDGQGHTSWTEAQTWFANRIIPENGLSGWGDAANGQYHFGISADYATSGGLAANKQYAMTTNGWDEIDIPTVGGDYLPLSGGTVSGATYFSAANGQNMLAVASAATLIGASRQTAEHFGQDMNALGTTWMGVGSNGMHRGFFKYSDGGNVGALDSNNTMQVEFTPSNKGQLFAKAKNNGTDCPETQILNPVKTTCDNMTTSGVDANNMSGPNYMIAKNADGQFVIGAAVFNCQGGLPGTLQPNTYYFVY